MYLPLPPQPDCATAWLTASTKVNGLPGHEGYNVIIHIADPTARATIADPIVAHVNDFLMARNKSVETVANTIFPEALYRKYGAPKFMDVFENRILPKVKKTCNWSGYYFERMIRVPKTGGGHMNQLWGIVERIRNPAITSLTKYELSLFDPERDVNESPYGGQCLSFLSFKLTSGSPQTLHLTAVYRNHYYTEKLLGNLIGLSRLMAFVAKETGTKVGTLTIHSTHAQVDTLKASRGEITNLHKQCSQAA